MGVETVKGKTVNFIGEWLTSSVLLLFDPHLFMPPLNKEASTAAARVLIARKQVGFAASSVLVAILIAQVAERRSNTGITPGSIKKSVSLSLLIVGGWVIWSLIFAAVLKLLGGTRAPITNILFEVRALATFYVLSVVIASIVFLALGNNWTIFELVELTVSFGLYVVYCPLIFGRSNDLGGSKFISLVVVAVALSALKTVVTLGAMISNPGMIPIGAPT